MLILGCWCGEHGDVFYERENGEGEERESYDLYECRGGGGGEG